MGQKFIMCGSKTRFWPFWTTHNWFTSFHINNFITWFNVFFLQNKLVFGYKHHPYTHLPQWKLLFALDLIIRVQKRSYFLLVLVKCDTMAFSTLFIILTRFNSVVGILKVDSIRLYIFWQHKLLIVMIYDKKCTHHWKFIIVHFLSK